MPILSKFNGIIIRMYWRDHNPPHIHVEYKDYEAAITLDGEINAGRLPQRELRLVREWIELHHTEIQENWTLAQNNRELNEIAPLK